jgi:outer membrane protein assembly factor BamB
MTPRSLFAFRPAALLALGLLIGCEAPTTINRGPDRTVDQRRKDFPIKHDDYAKIGYRLDWVGYPSVTGTLPIQECMGYPDLVVTLESGSFVSVLEPNTGAQRCADQLANYLTKFVGFVREGNFIYVASEGEIFTLDTRTCNLVGRQRTARSVSTEPVYFNNLLICGTGAGEVLAHLASGNVGGIKAWGFMSNGSFESKPVLIGGAVGAVSQAGQVVILDAQTGSLLGLNRIYDGLATDPVSDGRLMFVASLDQSIYAFAPQGASQVWRYRTAAPLKVQPTATADRLYCAIPDKGLTAFESGTGNVVWTTKGFMGSVVGTNKGRLVAWDGREAALIDAARGDIIDRAKLPGVSFLRTDKFDDGALLVVSKSGVVAKFQPK